MVHWNAIGETLGFKHISFWARWELSFKDRSEYVVTWNPMTWITDGIPWIIVDSYDEGKGTAPYYIVGKWHDQTNGYFNLCCWFY